jgi:L-fuculose-phosphate aldolase
MSLAEFQAVGGALASAGLISGASGNLSLRLDDRLVITRHGSILSALTQDDLVETGINRDDAGTPLASSELPVHRAIYRKTSAQAIVHSHAPHAVALSLSGRVTSGLPVFGESDVIVPGALAGEIAQALRHHSLVMVRGHGSFAVGQTLAEACKLTLEFEAECQAQGLKAHRAEE